MICPCSVVALAKRLSSHSQMHRSVDPCLGLSRLTVAAIPQALMHGSAIQVDMLLITGIARERGTAMENAETL